MNARPACRSPRGSPRRHQTRDRLIESGLLVLGRRSADGSIIDELIQIAGVSRGTYYNYFRDNESLLQAVAEEASNALIRMVNAEVEALKDPAQRVACGVRQVLRIARAHPHFVRFVARVGPAALGSGSLAAQVVPRDLSLGVSTGRFKVTEPRLGFDLVTGPVLAAFNSLQQQPISDEYIDGLAAAVLRSLGVPAAQASQIAQRPIAALTVPEDSLIVRAEARAQRSPSGH